MREWYLFLAAIAIMALGFVIGWNMAEAGDPDYSDTLFQVSTIDTLLLGGYDGEYTFQELEKHGDFGIGTFDGLDGEMTALDGAFYQIKADGSVSPVTGEMTTPFSSVTFFEPDFIFTLEGTYNYSEFIRLASPRLPSGDIVYAIRMDVTSPYIKARAIPRQEKPYPALADAAETQSVFIINNTSGSIVGFYTPEMYQSLNIPGFHLHYVDDERNSGGHILDFVLENATVMLDATTEFFMHPMPAEMLPEPQSERNLTEDLEFVELGR